MSEARLIDANRLITELWNAMWKYEDETEKRFLESDELDVGDWFSHRVFVQNMGDIDRDVVQKQPTVDAVPMEWIASYIRDASATGDVSDEMCAVAIKAMLNDYCADRERKDNGQVHQD